MDYGWSVCRGWEVFVVCLVKCTFCVVYKEVYILCGVCAVYREVFYVAFVLCLVKCTFCVVFMGSLGDGSSPEGASSPPGGSVSDVAPTQLPYKLRN